MPIKQDDARLTLARPALVVLSAALQALAFPPWNLSILAWVALVPLFLVLGAVEPRRAWLAGLVWGTAAIWIVAYWVPPALLFYYQQPWWFGLIFCVVGSIVLWGLYYATFAAAASWLGTRTSGLVRVLLVAVLWVSCELARSRLLTGEPWMLLGYSQVENVTLIQAADLGSVYLLSFVIVLVNAALAESLAARRTRQTWTLRPIALALVAVLSLYGYGRLRLFTKLPEAPAVPITIVQGNNDLGAQWRQDFYGRGLEQYLRMSLEAAQRQKPSVLVWPESSVTFFLAHEPAYQAAIARVLAATGTELLLGGPHHDGSGPNLRFFNSAFYLASSGLISGRYDKTHLLPFAEYFPLRFIEFLRRNFERVRTFTAGNGETLLETRMGKAAVVICFEAIFPELVRRQMARGAEVLVNLSNDAWLGRGAGAEQHAAMVVLRAVENRTWVIRATTTGISAIIDPYGRVVSRTGTFAPATLDAQIVPMRVDTVYKRHGDVFAFSCAAVSLVALLALSLRSRRPPARPPIGP